MLDRDRANVAVGVHIKNRVLIEVAGFGNRAIPKLDVQSVRVGEVANLHGLNPRLNHFPNWRLNRALNPLQQNYGSIGALPNRLEVRRRLHGPTLPEPG